MVLAVHVRQTGILDDSQHQVRQNPRILHNVGPWPIVALGIRGNITHVELDGGDSTIELVVQAGLDQAKIRNYDRKRSYF